MSEIRNLCAACDLGMPEPCTCAEPATEAGNAPVADMEGTAPYIPGEPAPVALTLDEAHQLRVHVEALATFAERIGVRLSLNVQRVDRVSAWDAFPTGVEHLLKMEDGRVFGTRTAIMGAVEVTIFTGDVS